MKILILTAGFGEGHNAAARNIRDAIELVSDEAKVEVLDLFEAGYGALNRIVRDGYLKLVRYAPAVWGGIYSLLDQSTLLNNNLSGFTRLRNALEDILHETQPDWVISTYPVYSHVIHELFKNHGDRPFKFMTVVTDSITVHSSWYGAPSDWFVVPNVPTADVLKKAGIAEQRIKAFGFPVSPLFATPTVPGLSAPRTGMTKKVLYLINTGKKKAGRSIDRLLEMPDISLTITVGKDAELKSRLLERTADFADRVTVLGWTNQMPQLMMTHHLVIGKAGGACVQETIAARCPMLINQVIPGQEEGNATYVVDSQIGAVARDEKHVIELVEEAFAFGGKLWQTWRENLLRLSRPDAAVRIAEFILSEGEPDGARKKIKLFEGNNGRPVNGFPAITPVQKSQPLMCDFHIHTNYSDGKLTVAEVVDYYGKFGFDCICITDHLADPRRLIGKLVRLSNLTLGADQLEEYFEVLERERKRAWRKYGMLLMTGIEFNKDGYTKKSSAHLLGIDLKSPINPAMDLPETIAEIHNQGGLAVASHPHIMKSQWGRNTLYLWENHEKFMDLIDAWEIANRNDIFSPIGLKKLRFLANSDFHKPKHIYSWKTLLHCAKEPEAIKACIRQNEHVAITLFRGPMIARSLETVSQNGRSYPASPLLAARAG